MPTWTRRGDEGQLRIHEVEENGPGRPLCVVRRVGGVVRRGDRLDGGHPTVDRIEAYPRADPYPYPYPYPDSVDGVASARVLLSGPGVSGLRRATLVVGTAGPRVRLRRSARDPAGRGLGSSGRPGAVSFAVTYRRSPAPGCGQLDVVRDGLYACAVCGATLPAGGNAAVENAAE
ncbi:hypothetical protein RGF97_05190 [Streptomyces roseicoloratus]|uniref:Uncharacterized protein n=1 Tax=Streptomyces roseicoloratus TaxID=2508722 RepID=A0ABY9RTV7_9ACTN|nr:hypothetical protein [Streptomyces roseicoloratus]WMX44370.1 hypothetical protein RGF97_05190 [Streptomyces roseicoloratus]